MRASVRWRTQSAARGQALADTSIAPELSDSMCLSVMIKHLREHRSWGPLRCASPGGDDGLILWGRVALRQGNEFCQAAITQTRAARRVAAPCRFRVGCIGLALQLTLKHGLSQHLVKSQQQTDDGRYRQHPWPQCGGSRIRPGQAVVQWSRHHIPCLKHRPCTVPIKHRFVPPIALWDAVARICKTLPTAAIVQVNFRKVSIEYLGPRTSEDGTEESDGDWHANQAKRHQTQPGNKKMLLFPEEIAAQDVADGMDHRPQEAEKRKTCDRIFDMPASRLGAAGGNKGMNRAIRTALAP